MNNTNEDTVEVLIDYNLVETIGGNWLMGFLVKTYKKIPKNIILVFPEPTLKWLEANKGPHLNLIPMSVLHSLVDDTRCLMEMGHSVTTKRIIKNPE